MRSHKKTSNNLRHCEIFKMGVITFQFLENTPPISSNLKEFFFNVCSFLIPASQKRVLKKRF